MNLVIDIGNSSAKLALFEQDKLVKTIQKEQVSYELIRSCLNDNSPDAVIMSSVKKEDVVLYQFLYDTFPVFYHLTYKLPMPLKIDYRTPKTLGMDRVASAIGASLEKPNTDLLIIDIGTAITIDFVSADGIYRGGNISPGPDMRFQSLYRFSGKLPLVDEQGEVPSMGYDTTTAIRAGVINGIVRELDSYIADYKKNAKVFTFLTGGYAFYFASKLKNAIFADENLVFKGLNEIIRYNERLKIKK